MTISYVPYIYKSQVRDKTIQQQHKYKMQKNSVYIRKKNANELNVVTIHFIITIMITNSK